MKTTHEIRLGNLEILVGQAGSAIKLAKLADTSQVYLSQVRRGGRSIGSALARKLEAAMGKPSGWLDHDHETGSEDPHAALADAPAEDGMTDQYPVEITDRSMDPVFRIGDVVTIDPQVAPKPGDYVLAQIGNGQHRFGRYRERSLPKTGGVGYEVVPENKDFAPLSDDQPDVSIVGVVTQQRRFFR